MKDRSAEIEDRIWEELTLSKLTHEEMVAVVIRIHTRLLALSRVEVRECLFWHNKD